MNKFKSITVAAVLSLVSVVTLAHGVSAITKNTNTAECNLNPVVATSVSPLVINQNFTYNSDGTVTAKYKIAGTDANCKKDVSLAVWSVPSGKQYPLSEQVFFDSATAVAQGKGEHTLTAKLPCGFWQIDLVEGADPKGINGTADYGGLGSNGAHMLDTYFAQTKCVDKVVVKPVEVPVEKVVVKTKTNTVVKEVPVTTAAPVSTVPSTGADAGSMAAGTVGLSTSAGLAYDLIRKRRLLK